MLASLAGASSGTAVRLAIAMACLQFSIGALNDLRDAAADAGRKGRKPIPRGLVGARTAKVVVGTGLALGLLLAAASGPAALAVAAAGVGVGYLYDLRLKGTALSWLPFCLGIPMVPVFAWVGATGGIPAPFVILVPLGAVAGAGIAVANALADVERDRAAGVASVATRLGPVGSWRAAVLLQGIVVTVALLSVSPWTTVAGPASMPATLALAMGPSLILGGLLIGRPLASSARRELGWEVQAAGVGLLGIGWLLRITGVGGGG